jgi:uncharacterized protein
MKSYSGLYDKYILGHPAVTVILLALVLAFFAYHSKDFKLDASADSLMLEDDEDLKLFREIVDRYGIQDFVVVTFSPREDLFSHNSLERLRSLHDDLESLERVDSVVSILTLPLLKNTPMRLSELSPDTVMYLEDPGVDVELARRELVNSPVYREYAISADGNTTAMLVKFVPDQLFSDVSRKRHAQLLKRSTGALTAEDDELLDRYEDEYEVRYDSYARQRHQDIKAIREIILPYKEYATVYLGGVPMIADDMITFIKNDLAVFGIGVFIFIVATLSIIFREVRWVVLPLGSCFFAVMIMLGLLGLAGWKVTVISSNFISLMLILTMSMNIHLVVRYRQLCADMPDVEQRRVVLSAVCKMVWPCLYTGLTTILAFMSLVFSGIRPVIDFGWMMTIGLTVTFVITFTFLPAVLMLLKKSPPRVVDAGQSYCTGLLASTALHHGGKVLLLAAVCSVVGIWGITQLKVENSFINYFRKNTEIYQGLKLIDDELGGSTPLDVVLSFGDDAVDDVDADPYDDDDDFGWISDYDPHDYWFTPYKIEMIKKAHDYLDALPEVGKVLSLASVIRVVEDLNDGRELDGLELGVLYKKLPEQIKADVLTPFVSVEHNEARLSLRVLDSRPDIRRKELLEKISSDLDALFSPSGIGVTKAGLLVLYNNMLQSLFRSQILTMGIVLLGIGGMLLVLFRSLQLALIGIVPNLLAVAIVLGIMGVLNIPLDMMTITIAAITMGIAIDNSIHYLYRYREEFAAGRSYSDTLTLCHNSVGKAILNSAVTIIFGFSILMLSNFIPTIYFGIFTGLAMLIALMAVLGLMPKLILIMRPFGGR